MSRGRQGRHAPVERHIGHSLKLPRAAEDHGRGARQPGAGHLELAFHQHVARRLALGHEVGPKLQGGNGVGGGQRLEARAGLLEEGQELERAFLRLDRAKSHAEDVAVLVGQHLGGAAELGPGSRGAVGIEATGLEHVGVVIKRQRVRLTGNGILLGVPDRRAPASLVILVGLDHARRFHKARQIFERVLCGEAGDVRVVDGDEVGHVAGCDALDELLRQLAEGDELGVVLLDLRVVPSADVLEAGLGLGTDDMPHCDRVCCAGRSNAGGGQGAEGGYPLIDVADDAKRTVILPHPADHPRRRGVALCIVIAVPSRPPLFRGALFP